MNARNVLGSVSVIIAALSAPSHLQSQVLAVTTLEGTYLQRVNNSTWQAIHVGPGGTSLQFQTTKNNEKIVITYSASCLAGGFIIYVRANVDGVIASPGATTGVSLCSTAVAGSMYPANRTFYALIARMGVHKVTIEMKGDGAAIQIGESALVVQR